MLKMLDDRKRTGYQLGRNAKGVPESLNIGNEASKTEWYCYGETGK